MNLGPEGRAAIYLVLGRTALIYGARSVLPGVQYQGDL